MSKIWISRIDEFIEKENNEKIKNYLVWVKRIQGNYYRLYKTTDKESKIHKIVVLCLSKNYELLYSEDDNQIEKHLQQVWTITEKLYELSKEDKELSKTCSMVFAITWKVAQEFDFKINDRRVFEYANVKFDSRLHAKWAKYFHHIGMVWRYKPDGKVNDWQPDFKVAFKCGHSSCNGSHIVALAVKPYPSIDKFKNHPCMDNRNWMIDGYCGSGGLGNNPNITEWGMLHGDGGGTYNLEQWGFEVDMEYWSKIII